MKDLTFDESLIKLYNNMNFYNGRVYSFSFVSNVIEAYLIQGKTPIEIENILYNTNVSTGKNAIEILKGLGIYSEINKGMFREYQKQDVISFLKIGNDYSKRVSLLLEENPLNEFEINQNLESKKHDNFVTGGENILLYGVPGSGKSHTIDETYKHGICRRVVFHPDYMNSDFVGQILPVVKSDKTITYEFTPGPFTKIMKDAYNNPFEMYYLIIEEINRGNAPAIFGDIFQLLDRVKDGTSRYEIINHSLAKEMYGDENHSVKIPSNLTLVATMNTSDQNVFTLDTAFQRRWNMRMIINDINKAEHKLYRIIDTDVTWGAFNEIINNQVLTNNVSMLSSEDKRLGIYFISPEDLKTTEKAAEKFSEKVIKYLWDDAFKFTREKLFNTTFKSLEELVVFFINQRGNERFNIFNENIKNLMLEFKFSDSELNSVKKSDDFKNHLESNS